MADETAVNKLPPDKRQLYDTSIAVRLYALVGPCGYEASPSEAAWRRYVTGDTNTSRGPRAAPTSVSQASNVATVALLVGRRL